MGRCLRCGAFRVYPAVGESWERRNAAWFIPVTILTIALVFAGFVFIGYRAAQRARKFRIPRTRNQQDYRRNPLPGQLPVQHGGVARPEELHGHGKLYFVPVGKQGIPVQTLADYYVQKFGIRVTVLPHVDLRKSDCVAARKQCVAEELAADMTSAYSEIARDPNSVMIALTDEDIFPRSMGWEYTNGFHWTRIAIVSSRRMDPAFFGDPPNYSIKLSSTKQILSKNVALLYFHVPESFDPTSVMFTPLTPDAGPDDIYESDLHPEDSVNGRLGKSFPCLYFSYSYQTHKMTADSPVLSDCRFGNPVSSTREENFETSLGYGRLTQRSIDLQLNSTPAITLRRGYNTDYPLRQSLAFGWGANHSYDLWLSSDGMDVQSFSAINHEDGTWNELERITPGRGFTPDYVFESHEDVLYGARQTWDSNHYKLTYRDDAWSTFLPCTANTHCFWTGYHDAKGNTLIFDRGPGQELRQLTASDHQGISFTSDSQMRTVEAKGTNGEKVSYEYGASGCLAKVIRADGQITLYKYDLAHQMTEVAVMRKPGARPETILSNEYNSQGRVVKQTLAGLGIYKIQYVGSNNNHASEWRITLPDGKVWKVEETEDETYVVHSGNVRFAAVERD